ncbi:hypothetical protein DFH09DRAFT_1332286 [Mycena vulgaris]|nr:hypothetical protein DFH09DRAFT_1332286 [Mycena vulgaris]
MVVQLPVQFENPKSESKRTKICVTAEAERPAPRHREFGSLPWQWWTFKIKLRAVFAPTSPGSPRVTPSPSPSQQHLTKNTHRNRLHLVALPTTHIDGAEKKPAPAEDVSAQEPKEVPAEEEEPEDVRALDADLTAAPAPPSPDLDGDDPYSLTPAWLSMPLCRAALSSTRNGRARESLEDHNADAPSARLPYMMRRRPLYARTPRTRQRLHVAPLFISPRCVPSPPILRAIPRSRVRREAQWLRAHVPTWLHGRMSDAVDAYLNTFTSTSLATQLAARREG